jgi:transposase
MPVNKSGRKIISAEKAFLLCVWYLSNQESFRQVADRFDVTLSSAHRCVRRVLTFVLSIKKQVIKWPSDDEEAQVTEGF